MKAKDLIAECGHLLNEGCGWEQAPADPKVRPTGWKPSMGNKFVEDPKTGEHVQLVYRCGPAPQNTSSMLAPGKRGFGYNDKYEFSGDTDLTNLSWKEQGKVGKKFLKNKAAVKRDPTIKVDPEAMQYLESKTMDTTKLRELAGLPVTETMISGDWERLGITNDEIALPENKDAVFPGVWSVGRGGPKSQYFYFNKPDTSGHFATIVDMGRGTFKVLDATGQAVHGASEYRRNRGTFGLSWAEAEAKVAELI